MTGVPTTGLPCALWLPAPPLAPPGLWVPSSCGRTLGRSPAGFSQKEGPGEGRVGVHTLGDSTAVLFPKSEQAECGAAEGSSVPWAATSQGGRGETRGKRDALPFGQTVHPHLFHPEHNKKHARGPALTCCSPGTGTASAGSRWQCRCPAGQPFIVLL